MDQLKILSWNLEHFDGEGGLSARGRDRDAMIAARQDRLPRVISYLQQESPDIFGLSEVKSIDVYHEMVSKLSDYAFHITEGQQSQQILIGVKKYVEQPFFRQLNGFRSGNPGLRPGAQLTVIFNGQSVSILFTHFKSLSDPKGFGLRDDMFRKVASLKKKMDEISEGRGNGPANLIVIGDMNTMGMDYRGLHNDISATEEIAESQKKLDSRGMVLLPKTHPTTFSNGSKSTYPPSDLDHVFASNHLNFEPQNRDGALVRVTGWAELPTTLEQDNWILENSDHAPIIVMLKP